MSKPAAKIGDNSVAKEHLRAFVERIETVEAQRKELADDVKDIYAEAKGNGYDVRALRTVIRMRKQDADERKEQESIVDVYLNALGMLPLFEASK